MEQVASEMTIQQLPIVFRVPYFGNDPLDVCWERYSLLGIGDVLIPGMLVGLCHGLDLARGNRTKVYYVATLIGKIHKTKILKERGNPQNKVHWILVHILKTINLCKYFLLLFIYRLWIGVDYCFYGPYRVQHTSTGTALLGFLYFHSRRFDRTLPPWTQTVLKRLRHGKNTRNISVWIKNV